MIKEMNRPLRILMTTDSVGGVWRHSLELVRELERYACRVHLVSFGRDLSPGQKRELAAFDHLDMTASDLRLEWMEDPWRDVERTRELLRLIVANFQPDVIHLNSYALAAEEWNVPVVVGAHSCISSWWSAVRRESLPARFDLYSQKVAAGLRAATTVVAPSAAMLNELKRHYETDFEGMVIHNGVHSSDFVSAPKKPHILSAGRLWDEAKNIRLLEKIASKVKWPIFVAGEITTPEGEKSSFSSLECLGSLSGPAIRREYAEASVYAAPALYEPFGQAILEAALSGCALVLADISSLRELWQDAAIFVAPRDLSSWEQTLNRLISEPEERRRLAARSKARARHFSAQLMAEKYHTLYSQLAQRAGQPIERLAA